MHVHKQDLHLLVLALFLQLLVVFPSDLKLVLELHLFYVHVAGRLIAVCALLKKKKTFSIRKRDMTLSIGKRDMYLLRGMYTYTYIYILEGYVYVCVYI